MKSGKVRRARLYYLRNLTGKAARLTDLETGDGAGSKASASEKSAETKAEKKESKDSKPSASKKPAAEARAAGAATGH